MCALVTGVQACALPICHPLLGAFLRERLGEAVDARFGGGIVDLPILPRLAVDRTDVDDAAPAALDHAGKAGLGHVEAAAEVDAHHVVPVVIAHPREGAAAGDAGVVDHDVDGPDLFGNPRAAVEIGRGSCRESECQYV